MPICPIFPGIVAFVNLFPRELVTESASRMLTYALMLGLAGQVAEAHAWLRRPPVRIEGEPEPRAEDVATVDLLRLLTFSITGGAGNEINGHGGRSKRSRRAWTSGWPAPARG